MFTLTLDIMVFLIGTFAAALVTGVAGFAFGMVAAAIWLHALPPAQTTALIAAEGHRAFQALAVDRRQRDWRSGRPWGIEMGADISKEAPRWCPAHLVQRLQSGPPENAERRLGRPGGDGSIGVLKGVLGGATGLGGILPTIWSGMRGWTRDEQRAVFQPTAAFTFVLCLVAFSGTGVVTQDVLRLFAIGLPALIAGTLVGWSIYGKLDEATFRKIVLWLLLISGLAIVLTGR